MHNIVKIQVTRMWETCERTSYYVELTTDEGFTITPVCHQTGSLYNDFQGLSVDEARDRALIEADTWGDFLQIEVEPYEENGVLYTPSFPMRLYTTRRELSLRKSRASRL